MKSCQLNPAQLMMGFLSTEHEKLGKKIVASEFSKELEAQSSGSKEAGCFGFTLPEGGFAQDTDSGPGSITIDQRQLSQASLVENPVEGRDGQKVKALQRLSSPKKPLQAARERIREDLVITDVAILEKVVAQLQLPAETRKNLKSAEDPQGRISLKTLESILNQQTPSARNVLPGQDQAAAQDVQQLLNSIRRVHPDQANTLPQFKAKPGGAYTIEEFKNTLDGVAQQIAVEKTKSKQALVGSVQSDPATSSTKAQDAAGSSTSVSPGQVQRLTGNLMPSFSEKGPWENNGSKGASSSDAPEVAGVKGNSHQRVTALSDAGGRAEASVQPQASGRSNSERMAPSDSSSSTKAQDAAGSSTSASPGQVQRLTNNLMPSFSEKVPGENNGSKDANSSDAPGVKGNSHQRVTALSDAGGRAETSVQPQASGRSNSERMAQLGSLDSSLVPGVEEEVGRHHPDRDGKAFEDHSGSSPSDTGSRQNISKIASLHTSSDPSSQDNSREMKEGRRAAILQSGEKGPQVSGASSRADSFQAISSSMQSTQAGPQGSQAASSPTLSLASSNWPLELSERFHELQQQKRNELVLELEPKHMGKLTLRIETDHNQVTAWVATDNDHVKSLLTQNSPILKQHLEEQGLMLDQFHVDVRQENGGQSSPQQNRSPRKQNRSISAVTEAETGEVGAGPSRMVYRQDQQERLISFVA